MLALSRASVEDYAKKWEASQASLKREMEMREALQQQLVESKASTSQLQVDNEALTAQMESLMAALMTAENTIADLEVCPVTSGGKMGQGTGGCSSHAHIQQWACHAVGSLPWNRREGHANIHRQYTAKVRYLACKAAMLS